MMMMMMIMMMIMMIKVEIILSCRQEKKLQTKLLVKLRWLRKRNLKSHRIEQNDQFKIIIEIFIKIFGFSLE